MKTWRIVLLGAATVLAAQVSRNPPEPPGEFKPGPPVEQPLPFSHRAHTAFGAECLDCHPIKAPGDYAGIPKTSQCMACHSAIKPARRSFSS